MASLILTTDDSADQTNEMSTPGKSRRSSVSVAHRSHEHTGEEVNIVRIIDGTPATEKEQIVQQIDEVEAQSDNPGLSLNQSHCEHCLQQAFEAAFAGKDLRDRVASLEKSLAELRGASKPKPAPDVEDGVFRPSAKASFDLNPARIPSPKWHHPNYAEKRKSSVLAISVKKSTSSSDDKQIDLHLETANQIQNEVKSDDSETTKSRGPRDPNWHVGEVPDRLEINSPLLREDLLVATGIDLGEKPVILTPFKLLVLYEQEIRHHLESREEIYKDLVDKARSTHALKAQSESTTNKEASAYVKDNPLLKTTLTDAVIVEVMTAGPAIIAEAAERAFVADKALATTLKPALTAEEEAQFDAETVLSIKSARDRVDYLRCVIAFDDLWHLFNPGELIIASNRGHYQAYRVLHVSGGRPLFSSERPSGGDNDYKEPPAEESHKDWTRSDFDIDCFSTCFDGEEIAPIPRQFAIAEFEGERPITSLAAFPLKFVEDDAALRARLLKRGKRFKDVAGVSHKTYSGHTMGTPPEEIDSDAIVDFATSFQYNDAWIPRFNWEKVPTKANSRETFEVIRCDDDGCTLCTDVYNDTVIDNKRYNAVIDQNPHRMMTPMKLNDERLSEEHYELLPVGVNAYVLRNRRWYVLNLDLLKDVDSDEAGLEENGFKDLVIPLDYKDIVEALVKNHSRGTRPTSGEAEKEQQLDLVKGKGKGIIILLHGVPGVGKTSTAECVAAYTKRPLYPITCGDIGDTAENVERNLEHHFRLAHQWGCVCLLDEADVFLGKRSGENITRNGLVSVFLRVLEYYAGILFLTTNRVGSFDEAFRSRIHLSLYYPPLDKDSTTKIWKNNLDRIERSGRLAFNREKIMGFADKLFKNGTRWNGRQIRNAFQTAISLAGYDQTRKLTLDPSHVPAKPKLTKDHFKKVAKASADFDEYVKEVMGGQGYSEKAEMEELRADSFRIDSVSPKPNIRAVRGPTSTPSKADSSINGDSDEDGKERRKAKQRKMRRDKNREKEEKMESARRGKESAAAVSSLDDSGTSD